MRSRGGTRGDVAALERAKERLLAGDEGISSEATRERILASWRRSRLNSVTVDQLDPPFDDALDFDCSLVRATRPVLDRLDEALSGTAMSILLTDRHGRILERRVSDPSLARHLDRIHLAPGFSYAEEHVGTNGIGSAIECRAPFFVDGAEHFVRPLAGVSCAGAPIFHPLTGRLEGVIDLTCRVADATRLMEVLAAEAATDITSAILDEVGAAERALLRAFLAAKGSPNRAIVAVSGDLVMTNSTAAGLLERGDHALLREWTAQMLRQGRTHGSVVLSDGRCVRVHLEAVGSFAGAICELRPEQRGEEGGGGHPLGAGPLLRGELVGSSGAWRATWAKVERCCRSGERLLLLGEGGTGKLALALDAHRLWRSGHPLETIDLAKRAFDTSATLARVRREGGTVVLRHLEAIGPDARMSLLRSVWELPRATVWVVGTAVANGDERSAAPEEVTDLFEQVIVVPPLRHRIEDLRQLVPSLLCRRVGPDRVRVDASAYQALLRYPWPGNVAELDQVLALALRKRPNGTIRAEDLPGSVHCTSPRVLGELEALERDRIVEALIDCNGDKTLAANRLGISRATIYRKIRSYGIVLDAASASVG